MLQTCSCRYNALLEPVPVLFRAILVSTEPEPYGLFTSFNTQAITLSDTNVDIRDLASMTYVVLAIFNQNHGSRQLAVLCITLHRNAIAQFF